MIEPGRNAGGDQVGDAVGDHARLARARPSEDQVVSVRGGRRRALGFVQLARKVMAQSIVQRGLENNLPHATPRPRGKPWRLRSTNDVILYQGTPWLLPTRS